MTELPQPPAKGQSPILRIGLAILLLLPALCCCASQDAVASVMTFVTSLQKVDGLDDDAEFVGIENYARTLGDRPFLSALGFTVQVVIVRVLAVSILPLLIGLGLAAVSGVPRKLIRIVLTIPLALFIPVAIGITWRLLTSPRTGLIDAPLFANPDTAGLALLLIDGLYVLGIAAAAGALLYPLASKGGRVAAIVVFATLLLAAIASGLQTSTLMEVTTGGGPGASTTSLILLMSRIAVQRLQFGAGAAVGTVILIPVMLLGLIAGIVIVLSRIALAPAEAATDPEPPASRPPLKLALLGLGLLPALACCAISALPLPWIMLQSFGGDSYGGFFESANLGAVLLNTIAPAFVSAFLIQLPIALAGAFAIGGLRPLGKWSEVLLLAFSPWLFITIAPLMVPLLQGLIAAGRVGEFTAFFTPLALSVPMLFVLTLFFKGHTAANPEMSLGQLLLRSLPLALGAAAVLFFVQLIELQWPLFVARNPQNFPFTVLLFQISQRIAEPGALGAGLTLFWLPVFIVFLVIFGAWLAFYGDRLVLKRDV